MPDDHNQFTESNVPRSQERRGHFDDPAPQTKDSRTDSESESTPSDHESVARDLRHSGEEHPEISDKPIEGELVTKEVAAEVARAVTSLWTGPTPSPETLRQFNEVDPSFAERAFRMSEDTVDASNYERRQLVDGDVAAVKRGQWMAWTMSVVCIVFAMVSLVLGFEVIAGLFVAPAIFQFLGSLIRTVRTTDNPSDSQESIED